VIEWFAEQPFPALAIFGRSNEVPIASVAPDMATAATAATKHLLQLGHRRIVNLCRKPRRLPQPGQPEQAFLDELKAAGIAAGDFNLPDWTETPQGLHDLLSSLFRVTPPTALIINEVPLYMAVQQFLAQKQLRVPEEVSLIADNADPTFAWFQPSVAHISWSPEPIVRRTLRWATSAQRGRADRSQIRYPAEFIAGGTTAKAR
jgi:DNA-binding LacI/PurR family transcriptional regulator